MGKIDFLENLLEEVDSLSTLDEVREKLEELLDEAYQEQECKQFLLEEDFDTDNEDF